MLELYTQKQLNEKLKQERERIDFERYIDTRFRDMSERIDRLEKHLYILERENKSVEPESCTTTL